MAKAAFEATITNLAGTATTRTQTQEVYTLVDTEKARGKAEQLKGKAEQAVGNATGSEETQDRGKIDEAKGTIREKTADVKGKVKAAIKKPRAS